MSKFGYSLPHSLPTVVVVDVMAVEGEVVREDSEEVVFTYSYGGVDGIASTASVTINVTITPLTARGGRSSNVSCDNYENIHIHTYTHTYTL